LIAFVGLLLPSVTAAQHEEGEERVIGIEGDVSAVTTTSETRHLDDGRAYEVVTVTITLTTSERLAVYEDGSMRIANVDRLHSTFAASGLSDLQFAKEALPDNETLLSLSDVAVGDRLIIRTPYWSVDRFLEDHSQPANIYSIETVSQAEEPEAADQPTGRLPEPPPAANHLCGEHVTGDPNTPMHIQWNAYGVSGSMDDVVSFYRDLLGIAPELTPEQANWTLADGTTTRSVVVTSAEQTGPWRTCGEIDSPLVVLISVAVGPDTPE